VERNVKYLANHPFLEDMQRAVSANIRYDSSGCVWAFMTEHPNVQNATWPNVTKSECSKEILDTASVFWAS
jgi:hypothetical protein